MSSGRPRQGRARWTAQQELRALRGTVRDPGTYLRDLRGGVPIGWLPPGADLLTRACVTGEHLDWHLQTLGELAALSPASPMTFTANWRGEKNVSLPRALKEDEYATMAFGAQLTEVATRLALNLNADPTSKGALAQAYELQSHLMKAQSGLHRQALESLMHAFHSKWRGLPPARCGAQALPPLPQGKGIHPQPALTRVGALQAGGWVERSIINPRLGNRRHPLRELARSASVRAGGSEVLNMTVTVDSLPVPSQAAAQLHELVLSYPAHQHAALTQAMNAAQPPLPPRPAHLSPLDWALRHTWWPETEMLLNGELEAAVTFATLESCLRRDPEVAWQLPRLQASDPKTNIFRNVREHYPQLSDTWYLAAD